MVRLLAVFPNHGHGFLDLFYTRKHFNYLLKLSSALGDLISISPLFLEKGCSQTM